ncbi:FAD/NAD(P)-binding domain-containing protein [Aspergillus violaceofuscus CBS 115571]|uniref:FAD/NAD(P)-binding domain-containing protein n=1 Tax=Aspergillus violaceofuscus (strain CBS 115571) TaxID=1450538 RepID=A0A2V5HA37_ASPV1|nr:FAD/NAD(P)-binding domain-containing protein [Aspergillus violaceofuscus CBS 115571]
MAQNDNRKKRVAVIGAGAAGMSCASTLANHPDKFDITLIDSAPQTGGQATTIPLDAAKHGGATWLNDGVQGGSPIFRHTFHFFEKYGYEPHPVQLQVSFGKGRDSFFTNVFPSPLVDTYSAEISKLGRVLRWIKRLMPILGLMPIKTMLRLFRFSTDFGLKMVLPLIALFLGTGNQTPNVACVLLERLFDDPQMRLWEYDEDMLMQNRPQMYTFPNLGEFYRDWKGDLAARGVRVLLETEVDILDRKNKRVKLRLRSVKDGQQERPNEAGKGTVEDFDELILCCPADEALSMLGPHATWRERYVLNGVKFFNDLTITHTDAEYFNSLFETRYKEELCGKASSETRQEQIAFAQQMPPRCRTDGWEGFAPMYFTHSFDSDPDKIEMGFDCTHYQHQFREAIGEDALPPEPERHVYQTIFLNEDHKHLWTWEGIDKDKIIGEKWWHQFGHRWQHYLRVVPGMMFINGKNNTLYAGAWTMVNMHEIACISGMAAAYRLGAVYEPFDDFAEDVFSKYLLVSHGVRYKRRT